MILRFEANLGFLYFKDSFLQPKKGIEYLEKALQLNGKLPDKGKKIIDFLKNLSFYLKENDDE